MPEPKIAIIGAGPAGCTLALLLHKASIPCTVFEGETSANVRNQGGSLDLHEDTGLKALKRAGLHEQFTKLARYDAEAMKITNKNLRIFIDMAGTTEGTSRGRPEIDRSQLRTMLVDAIPSEILRWGHRLRRVDDSDVSNIKLHFDNGAVETGFDLIVGADGAWSKIRPLLTTVKPFHTGITMFRYSVHDAANKHPELHRLVNRGSCFAFGDGKALTAQQMGDGSLNVGCSRTCPEDFLANLPFDKTDLTAFKRHDLGVFKGWDPQLRALIEAADGDAPWTANLYTLPVGLRWQSRPGVTVIGDAAHLMGPWAGEGVNLSMEDSVELADRIIEARKDSVKQAPQSTGEMDVGILHRKVIEYEEAMFVRAGKTAQTTWNMMTAMFYVTGAPDVNIDTYISEAVSNGVPALVAPIITTGAKLYFKWFRWWYPGTGKIGEVR